MGRCGTRVIWRKLDCLNPSLQSMKILHPPEKTPVTGAAPRRGITHWPVQPLGRGAMPSEGIEGDEWGAYVTLSRMSGTNMGSPSPRVTEAP